MTDLKTDQVLLDAIRNARPMTAEQMKEQRVSWVFGQICRKSPLAKEQVRAMLNMHETPP